MLIKQHMNIKLTYDQTFQQHRCELKAEQVHTNMISGSMADGLLCWEHHVQTNMFKSNHITECLIWYVTPKQTWTSHIHKKHMTYTWLLYIRMPDIFRKLWHQATCNYEIGRKAKASSNLRYVVERAGSVGAKEMIPVWPQPERTVHTNQDSENELPQRGDP